ncbi:MAG: YdbC family protein [Sporolactobacillus sp.]
MASTGTGSSLHFSILKQYGVLSTESSGWSKELNLVSWNDREAKYDIRSWAPDKKKMGRGITLTGDECALLRTLLNSRFPKEIPEIRENSSSAAEAPQPTRTAAGTPQPEASVRAATIPS